LIERFIAVPLDFLLGYLAWLVGFGRFEGVLMEE